MFIVQELQTTNGTTALLPAEVYETRNEAESAFHMKLASASVSTVDIHAVMLYAEYGNVLRCEYYDHTEAASNDNL